MVLVGCTEDPQSAREPSEPQRQGVEVTAGQPEDVPLGSGIEVRDGDTGKPVKASLRALGPGTRVTEIPTGPNGRAQVPVDTRAVRAFVKGYSVGRAVVADGAARVEVYRKAIQSPEYGGGPLRRRHVPAVKAPLPGARPTWRFNAKTLIEFPPAVRNGLLVFGVNSGRVFALDQRTGAVRWAKRHRGEIASTPSMVDGQVYVSSMDGRVTAYREADGQEIWSFSTEGSPIESSPLVVDERVIVGDWGGRLYSIDARTGTPVWTFQAAGDLKASAALSGDTLVIGDYVGRVYGVNFRTGALKWEQSAGARFYGGAAISDGIAVIGDIGGDVLALDVETGEQRWRRSMGNFVYASPAVADGTVYIGSYSGRFDALALNNGAQRWSFNAGERISGSATVVGDVVYTSVLSKPGAPRRTFALDRVTGAIRWQNEDGRYSPAVAAGRGLFLVGTNRLYAYVAP